MASTLVNIYVSPLLNRPWMRGSHLGNTFVWYVKAISTSSSLFCGLDGNRTPNHNVIELEKKTFYDVGVLIALSLVHGGPAPHFFSPAVADYIIHGVQNVRPTIEDVPQPGIRQCLQKV